MNEDNLGSTSKAYGSAKIRQQIADEGALAVIPSKSNAKHPIAHDRQLYAQRNTVGKLCAAHTVVEQFQGRSSVISACLWPLTMALRVAVR